MAEAKPARKAPAKRTAKKTATPTRKRGTISPPKPPVLDNETVETKEEVPAVTETVDTPESPKRGRKPNLVGQANARFQKAGARLERAQKRAARVQSVNDELAAAELEYNEAANEYRAAFEASLNTVPVSGDDE